MVMSHEPYIKLVIGFLFTSLAFMVRTHPCLTFWESKRGAKTTNPPWLGSIVVRIITFDLPSTVAGGKLCTFPHLHSRPQEGLSEYSPGHHGECFYFWAEGLLSMQMSL